MNSNEANFPQAWADWSVALAHDWLTGMRGGEQVLDILCHGFPSAEIYTLIHNSAAVSDTINAHPIHTSWMQRLPDVHRRYRNFLPFFPSAVRGLRPAGVDLLISTSHCVAKAVRPPRGARHLCYCFTPMRYAWLFRDEYFGRNSLKRMVAGPMLAWLRRWDRLRSSDVDAFVAISQHVRNRIQRFYGRDAAIVYPPVDTEFYTTGAAERGDFDLIVSALVPYKRVDLAVRLYSERNWPLKVVGIGGDLPKIKAIAGQSVEILEWQTREAIRELYRTCRCLVFPGEEDFGIVPVEAQACGAPIVAYGHGGTLETVRDGVSGIFFKSQTADSLAAAVEQLARRKWDRDAIRAHAEQFSTQRFIDALHEEISKLRVT